MNAAEFTPPAEHGPQSKQPTILVVDDEVLVRLAVAEFLREFGFRVLEAASGNEAVAVLTATSDIDVVFTDVQMPGKMDGFALARWVRSNRPGLPVLLTSGYPGTTRQEGEISEDPVLDKPYDFEVLVGHLNRLIGQPDAD